VCEASRASHTPMARGAHSEARFVDGRGMTVARGLFRDTDGWARVRLSDGREIDVPRARYVRWKWRPFFLDLPLADVFGRPAADNKKPRRRSGAESPEGNK
jgi:hypothetical protein